MAANWRGRAAISDCSEMEEIYPRELKTFVMRSVVIFAFGGSLARGVRKGGTATTLGAEAANRHGAKCEKYGDIERTLTGRGIKGHTGTSKGGVSEGLAMTNDEVCWRGGDSDPRSPGRAKKILLLSDPDGKRQHGTESRIAGIDLESI